MCRLFHIHADRGSRREHGQKPRLLHTRPVPNPNHNQRTAPSLDCICQDNTRCQASKCWPTRVLSLCRAEPSPSESVVRLRCIVRCVTARKLPRIATARQWQQVLKTNGIGYTAIAAHRHAPPLQATALPASAPATTPTALRPVSPLVENSTTLDKKKHLSQSPEIPRRRRQQPCTTAPTAGQPPENVRH